MDVQQKDFEKIYLEAYYYVFDINHSIKLNAKNSELDDLLIDNKLSSWAYITAYNPKSIPLCESENISRNENLFNEIKNHIVYKGESGCKKGNWEAEIGYLILGIELDEAVKLASKYEQNAFIFGELNQNAQLIFC